MAERGHDFEQEPLTGGGAHSRRFAPPTQMGVAGNRGRVPRNKLAPQPKTHNPNKPSESVYWAQMYITGFLVCWTVEAIILGCLAQWKLAEVGIIFAMIFMCALVFLTCVYWTRPLSKQITMAVIGVATAAAIMGGLFGGSYLQSFWRYGAANTWRGVGSSAPPSFWNGGDAIPNTFHFVNKTYVNVNLGGVVYRGGDLSYCVAPILGKDPVAQEKVIYYASAIDCCSGTSKLNVHTHCYHWGDHDLVGERIPSQDMAFFELAVTKASQWNEDFMTEPVPVFLSMMKPSDHRARQALRKRSGLIVIILTPFIWPLLAFVIYILRWLTVSTCGVHTQHAPGKPSRSQYAPVKSPI